MLADSFTVITYDRRGFSRSSWPAGATTTSVDEQADDAAALLSGLGVAPAVVYGNSSGAIITLGFLLRHPEAVRKAALHEPPLMAALPDPTEGMAHLREAVTEGTAAGGTRGGMEAFVRAGAGDAYDDFAEDHRERVLASGHTFLTHEFDRYEWYRPTDEELAGTQRPAVVLYGTSSPPFFRPVAEWLAARLGLDTLQLPGGHTPQRDRPKDVADFVRQFAST